MTRIAARIAIGILDFGAVVEHISCALQRIEFAFDFGVDLAKERHALRPKTPAALALALFRARGTPVVWIL